MTPKLHPACLICRLMGAAEGQPVAIAVGIFKLAATYQCRCAKKHPVLVAHPHAVAGCAGFRACAQGTTTIKEH